MYYNRNSITIKYLNIKLININKYIFQYVIKQL